MTVNRIAYVDDRGDLYTVDSAGQDRRLAVPAAAGRPGDQAEPTISAINWPTWSPDGRRIAYSKSGHIHVVNLDGTGEKRLATTDGFEDSPTWSPDGRQIAFRSNSTISVVDLDGGRARALASPGGTGLVNPEGKGANKLATSRGDPSTPQWSPDGTQIVFAVYQTGDACSIWVMSADGGVQTQITDNRTCDRDPAWQPLKP